MLFLPATVLLFLGAVVAAWNLVGEGQHFYYGLLLALWSDDAMRKRGTRQLIQGAAG